MRSLDFTFSKVGVKYVVIISVHGMGDCWRGVMLKHGKHIVDMATGVGQDLEHEKLAKKMWKSYRSWNTL